MGPNNKTIQELSTRIAANVGGGGGGAALDTQEGGVSVVAATTTLNFSGAGVSVTSPGSGNAKITIAGGGGSSAPNGFSPLNIASCDGSINFESLGETVLYLTIAENNMSMDMCTVWALNDGGAPSTIDIHAYRYDTGWGSAGSVPFAIGSSTTVVDGPNDITLAAAEAQTLNVVAGESIIIGIRRAAGACVIASANGLADRNLAQYPQDQELAVEFPEISPAIDDEAWIETNYRFGITFWEAGE